MIECTNCGALGEANFSTNYFGELVCELCGTQSFLQSRNETQDMEDTNLDMTKASTMKRGRKRAPRRNKGGDGRNGNRDDDDDAPWVGHRGRPLGTANPRKPRNRNRVTLLDCLRATQTILEYEAQALVQLGGFPEQYADVVQEIWFFFLETWELKSSKPLLRCYTEFFIAQTEEDKAMDPAVTQQLLEQWDAERDDEAAPAAHRAAAIAQAKAADADQDEDGEDNEDVEADGDLEEEETGKRKRGRPKRKGVKPELLSKTKKGKKEKRSVGVKKEKPKTLYLRHYSESLDRFSIVDLLGMLALAARVLNLGVLPSDIAYWVRTGQLPFHNLLSICTQELQYAVSDVSLFFESSTLNHRVSASRVAYHALYLQHHLELRLPPLNVSLVAYNMCANLGFPPQVFRHFQWIVAHFNTKGVQLPDEPLLQCDTKKSLVADLESSAGIAAHLAVAVRLCANWHEWIYERVLFRKHHVPAFRIQDALRMPRRELDDFIEFSENALIGIDRANIPQGFESHVYDLRGKYSELSQKQERRSASSSRANSGDEDDEASSRPVEHALHAYPALYVDGVCGEKDAEIEERVAFIKQMLREEQKKSGENEEQGGDDDDDDVFFYPYYAQNATNRVLHAAYENVLSLLCEYVDIAVGSLFPITERLDAQIKAKCRALEQRVTLTATGPDKRAVVESLTSP
ncbi:hypothetical protein Gpo141_00010415 [Globisporangium polare]